MITALVSGLFGAFNALLPDVVGYFKRKEEASERERERAHELAMIDKQVDAQLKIGQQRIDEIRTGGELELVRSEVAGYFDQMRAIYEQQKPIGIKWVDAWNAALRPGAVTLLLIVFSIGVTIYEVSVIVAWWNGKIADAQIIEAMFKGLVGESIQAVLGYLFGYRGTNSARKLAQQG